MENTRHERDGVFIVEDQLEGLRWSSLNELKQFAKKSALKRARICLHQGPKELIHEMLIVLCKDSYVRPHRHARKIESYMVLEGKADLVFFNDSGEIKAIVKMGDATTALTFFNRVPNNVFHMFVPRSEYFVFKETTNGPFDPKETEPASWAPENSLSEKMRQMLEVYQGKS